MNYSKIPAIPLITSRFFVPITFCLLFILNIIIFWPGQMSPDSFVQYNEAISGNFADHHPPIMAVLWKCLLFFFTGSGTLLIVHLMLLYAACSIFMQAFTTSKFVYYYMAFPLLPPILFYSSMIWKDVGFAFSFLLVAACLAYFIIHTVKPSFLVTIGILLVLFYGTAVKFQAIYAAPFLLFGLCYVFNNFKGNLKTVVYTLCASMALSACIQTFNNFFVAQDGKNNSWKFVKIYDLAGISLDLNTPMFPDYILQYKNFSMPLLKEKFNYERVDDIVFNADSPISRLDTAEQRDQLLSHWRKVVIQHPISYLKHRFNNWKRILFTKPLEKLDTLNFNDFSGLAWFAKLQDAKDAHNPSLITYCGIFAFEVLKATRYLFSFIIVFLCMLFYVGLAVCAKRNRLSVLLFCLNAAALALVVSLFILSMASSLRYVYMAVCLVHASHPIAYLIMRKKSF